jgi:acyl carrier protein
MRSELEVVSILKSMLVDEMNLGLGAEAIDASTSLFEDGLDLDSIVIVELISQVEQRFGFEFEDDDLRMASFENLTALAKVIQKRSP